MSNRKKHNVKVRFKETPKAPVDIIEKDGKVVGVRKTVHSIGNAWLHSTKGWRASREYHPLTLLNSLMLQVGVVPVEPN